MGAHNPAYDHAVRQRETFLAMGYPKREADVAYSAVLRDRCDHSWNTSTDYEGEVTCSDCGSVIKEAPTLPERRTVVVTVGSSLHGTTHGASTRDNLGTTFCGKPWAYRLGEHVDNGGAYTITCKSCGADAADLTAYDAARKG